MKQSGEPFKVCEGSAEHSDAHGVDIDESELRLRGTDQQLGEGRERNVLEELGVWHCAARELFRFLRIRTERRATLRVVRGR